MSEYADEKAVADPRLKLDLNSAMDFFGLTTEQKAALEEAGGKYKYEQRALTVLMWKIEEVIDQYPFPTEAERQVIVEYAAALDPEQLAKYCDGDSSLLIKEYDDNMRSYPPAERDTDFREEVSQYIAMADLVLRGNYMLIRSLGGMLGLGSESEFDQIVKIETRELAREKNPILEASRAVNQQHGWDKNPSNLF
jgi:hypothetical protein